MTMYLAHGGQMTGDEIAIFGGGLSFALLFPIVLLVIVAKTRPSVTPDVAETEPAAIAAPSTTAAEPGAPAVQPADSAAAGQRHPREEL